MQLLSAKEFAAESGKYYAGDRKARNPAHLLRIIRHEDLPEVLGPDNWAVVRYAGTPTPSPQVVPVPVDNPRTVYRRPIGAEFSPAQL
jgi:hypothetical protein